MARSATLTNWPADRVERWEVERVLPYARNARLHTSEQVTKIAASIERWGWTIPILVDEKGELIAGHGRVLAAKQLGINSVPTMVARGWTAEMIAAYRLADNKLGELSSWDDAVLAAELMALQEASELIGLIGFNERELEGLLAPETDPLAEWQGMPEFEQPAADAYRSIMVHFKDGAAVDEFRKIIGQTITDKTKFIWYPQADIETYADKAYTSEAAE